MRTCGGANLVTVAKRPLQRKATVDRTARTQSNQRKGGPDGSLTPAGRSGRECRGEHIIMLANTTHHSMGGPILLTTDCDTV